MIRPADRRWRRLRALAWRAEARLWTGPIAHLVAGLLDFVQALTRYRRSRR